MLVFSAGLLCGRLLQAILSNKNDKPTKHLITKQSSSRLQIWRLHFFTLNSITPLLSCVNEFELPHSNSVLLLLIRCSSPSRRWQLFRSRLWAGAPFICRQFAGPATVQDSQRGLLSVTPDSSVKDLQSRAESDARAQRWFS